MVTAGSVPFRQVAPRHVSRTDPIVRCRSVKVALMELMLHSMELYYFVVYVASVQADREEWHNCGRKDKKHRIVTIAENGFRDGEGVFSWSGFR